MATKLDAFTTGYIECALWVGIMDDEGTYSGNDFDVSDIAPEALDDKIEDCKNFQADNAELLEQASQSDYNGHDLWLTRNRHGAGFWDRGLGDVGRKLTDAAHAYGESSLYIGDDGKLHLS